MGKPQFFCHRKNHDQKNQRKKTQKNPKNHTIIILQKKAEDNTSADCPAAIARFSGFLEKGWNSVYIFCMLKNLLELFFVFFRIGAVTFGGGYAMLPMLERELVTKRGWATNEELLDYYAISQVTPGVIAVNVSTFVGYRYKKIPGAIFSTAGVVTPSLIIITLIALFIANFEDILWVQKALAGINVGVSALLTYSVLSFARKTIKKWWNLIFYACAFLAVFFLKIPTFLVVIAAVLGGIAIGFFSGNLRKIDAKKSGDDKSKSQE